MYYILKERYAQRARLKYKRNKKDPSFLERLRVKQQTYYHLHKNEEWFKRRNITNFRCWRFRKRQNTKLLSKVFAAWRSFKFAEEFGEVVQSEHTDKGLVHFP